MGKVTQAELDRLNQTKLGKVPNEVQKRKDEEMSLKRKINRAILRALGIKNVEQQ